MCILAMRVWTKSWDVTFKQVESGTCRHRPMVTATSCRPSVESCDHSTAVTSCDRLETLGDQCDHIRLFGKTVGRIELQTPTTKVYKAIKILIAYGWSMLIRSCDGTSTCRSSMIFQSDLVPRPSGLLKETDVRIPGWWFDVIRIPSRSSVEMRWIEADHIWSWCSNVFRHRQGVLREHTNDRWLLVGMLGITTSKTIG